MDVSPGGIVTVNQTAPSSYPSIHTFKSGTLVGLEAVPAFAYRFNNWSGDLSGTTNPTTIVIDCNKNIAANFSVSWPLVGEAIGAIVLAGLLLFVLVKRR